MRALSLIAAFAVALTILSGTATAAEFGIVPDSLTFNTLDDAGEPDLRAGVHPDTTTLGLELETPEDGTKAKDLVFELPPGFAGNPQAVDGCSREVFDQPAFGKVCPVEAQIGVGTVVTTGFGSQQVPIFAIDPGPDELGAFGFNFLLKFAIGVSLRPADMGMQVEMHGLSQILSFSTVEMELWGIPADHQEGTSAPRVPLLTTPTRCDAPLDVTVRVRSWEPGAPWLSATSAGESALTGCGDLPFEPSIGLELTNRTTDSLTGVEIDLAMPPDGLSERASSQIRSAKIDLPEGMSISPGAVRALTTCPDAALHRGQEAAASCPPQSRLGSVELASPLLRGPLLGSAFLGEERPGDRFRLFVVAKGFGLEAKLVGSIRPDPSTGRLTVILADLPQIPLSRLRLQLAGGPDAFLVNSLSCGPASIVGTFDPHSGGPTVQSRQAVSLERAGEGARCAAEPPFAPTLAAGSTNGRAGRPTSLSLTLRRQEGEESPSRFSFVFPAGLSVALGAVEPCSREAASRESCPPSARLGAAVAELGSGPNPARLGGDVFLTAPYRGAPFGLAIVFDVRVGPFDLGGLTLRGAVRVDPRSGRPSIETDSLPTAVEGLPIRIRAMALDIDRPRLVRNPTSCEQADLKATVFSPRGVVARLSSPFRVRGCHKLGFRPRVSMTLTGRKELRRKGAPGFRIVLRTRRGNSNLRRADIELPRDLSFNADRLQAICSLRDAREGECPRDSLIGDVTARTPLVEERLSGGIHAVQPKGSGPPDFWIALRSGGLRFDVRGRAAVDGGRTHARLVGLPDIQISRLDLRFDSGDGGVLSLAANPCAGSGDRTTPAILEGQDRAVRILRVPVRAAGCGGQRAR